MKRRSAFTLVELLVVIGIIAVLVGLLLPALNRARMTAKRVECAAYLRQIGIASFNYANDNKGYLPPIKLDNGQPTFNLFISGGSDHLPWIYRPWTADTNTCNFPLVGQSGPGTVRDDGTLIGRLVARKYLTSPLAPDARWAYAVRIMKCPSYSQGTEDPSGGYYFYNPHVAVYDLPDGSQVRQMRWKKLYGFGHVPRTAAKAQNLGSGTVNPAYQFPNMSYALCVDPINDLSWATHAQGKSRAWNMVTGDGSVSMLALDYRVGRQGGNFSRMEDLLQFLEKKYDKSSAVANSLGGNKDNWVPEVPWQ